MPLSGSQQVGKVAACFVCFRTLDPAVAHAIHISWYVLAYQVIHKYDK